MTVIAMSLPAARSCKTLIRSISVRAATLMGLGRRQVYRLAKAYHHRGPAALVSRKRGRPSNRAYPADVRICLD
jgi:Winged helix-turn helix